MTETHVKLVFDAIRPAWQILRDAGIAAPVDNEILYYVLLGAASLPYVNAPEVRLLTWRDPSSPSGFGLTPTDRSPSSCRDWRPADARAHRGEL
jgi:hypothetical protein